MHFALFSKTGKDSKEPTETSLKNKSVESKEFFLETQKTLSPTDTNLTRSKLKFGGSILKKKFCKNFPVTTMSCDKTGLFLACFRIKLPFPIAPFPMGEC